MNRLKFKGDWNMVKGKIKQKYAQLTDDDLRYTEGQEEELVGRLQKRTGETKEMIEQALNQCFADEDRKPKEPFFHLRPAFPNKEKK